MTTAFEFGFFEELQKIAAKSEKDDDGEKKYTPLTGKGMIADHLKHSLYGAAGLGLLGYGGKKLGERFANPTKMHNIPGVGGIPDSVAKGLMYGAGGAVFGGLLGQGISRLRARKRMKARLADQGLDEKSLNKLEESGVFKPRAKDVLPIYGKHRASHEVANALHALGKKVD